MSLETITRPLFVKFVDEAKRRYLPAHHRPWTVIGTDPNNIVVFEGKTADEICHNFVKFVKSKNIDTSLLPDTLLEHIVDRYFLNAQYLPDDDLYAVTFNNHYVLGDFRWEIWKLDH